MIRACCTEPVGTTFGGSGLGVIVALQFFNAQDWQKALLASGATIGLMFGPDTYTVPTPGSPQGIFDYSCRLVQPTSWLKT
jgi:hypothetical protein